ncbi:hypothetical protein Hanom_Chr05g00433671 [Helianthus anomalus]
MELTSRMKMARFQTFWIQMRKNKPLDESRKTGQTLGTKWHFTLPFFLLFINHQCVNYDFITKSILIFECND